MDSQKLIQHINAGGIDNTLIHDLAVLPEMIPAQRERYIRSVEAHVELYGDGDLSVFSVGGRSEISGNHTDHNHGKVIAACVNLDILAVAKKTSGGTIRVKSEGFPEDIVSFSRSEKPDPEFYFTSSAVIAGMERAFLNAGYNVGGFDAYTTSSVLKGSGLSSSAAFEVMVGNILNHLYNGGRVSNVEIAKMAQYAENVFFGKPCGLMDQTACAVGGFISIDFKDPKDPVIEKYDFDLGKEGYELCIVNTGGNHADLNEDYASVPADMKKVAAELGVTVLRETSEEALISRLTEDRSARERLGDRAILRAFHFFKENERVEKQKSALRDGDFEKFKEGVTDSGNSSFKFLQNVYTVKNVQEQGLSLALCLTEEFLRGTGGVSRVHGGGFAGTIQAFVPRELTAGYAQLVDSVFGAGSCFILNVRPAGACRLV
ncbi:MAG: galactokinase [Clostridia bacterium]|nr:galactokinase [Clostridia bacterium]